MHPPNWSRLYADEDWQALWLSEDSPVNQEIARLEMQLHDVRTDAARLSGIRDRLAGVRAVHETVERMATQKTTGGGDLVKPDGGRLRRLVDSVLPRAIG